MTQDQIFDVIQMFKEAARRAKEAGYDGVQIHAAHFFFLSRFISPAYSHCTDAAWGGSTEKRAKKEGLGQAIARVPGKSEAYLMTSFEDNCHLYFRGRNDQPIAYSIKRRVSARKICCSSMSLQIP